MLASLSSRLTQPRNTMAMIYGGRRRTGGGVVNSDELSGNSPRIEEIRDEIEDLEKVQWSSGWRMIQAETRAAAAMNIAKLVRLPATPDNAHDLRYLQSAIEQLYAIAGTPPDEEGNSGEDVISQMIKQRREAIEDIQIAEAAAKKETIARQPEGESGEFLYQNQRNSRRMAV